MKAKECTKLLLCDANYDRENNDYERLMTTPSSPCLKFYYFFTLFTDVIQLNIT